MTRRHVVLLVDDDAEFLGRLESAHIRAGYDIITANNGDEAFEIVRDILPDIVVTDLAMPLLDGLGLCRGLRELRAFDPVPLIMCTGAPPDDERVVEARALIGVTIIHKPIEPSDVVDLVDGLVGTPPLRLEGRVLTRREQRRQVFVRR